MLIFSCPNGCWRVRMRLPARDGGAAQRGIFRSAPPSLLLRLLTTTAMKAFGLRSLHSLLPRFSLAPAAATTTIAHTAAAAVANAPLTLTRGMAAQGGGGGGVGGRGKRRNKKKQGDSRVSASPLL